MVTIGTTNNENGFSVVFSEPVNLQLGGWSGLAIQPEDRPDESVTYNTFNFIVDIQPGFPDYNISFGVKRSNDAVSIYKATYDTVSKTWALEEITPAP